MTSHTVTTETVASWIAAYLDAWRSYDADAIADLFSKDATYAYNPWETPMRGNTTIAESWLSDRDEPGTWEADYRPVLIKDEAAIIVGETRYADGHSYSNLFQVMFDEDGRCASFVEWYIRHPKTKPGD